jgi:hypothetical protein
VPKGHFCLCHGETKFTRNGCAANVHFCAFCFFLFFAPVAFPAPQTADELDAFWRVAYARYITARAVEREDLLARLALDLSCPSWPTSLVAVDYDDAVRGHYVDEHMMCLRALVRLLLGVDDLLPPSPFAGGDNHADNTSVTYLAVTVWAQAPLAVASVFGAAAALDPLAQMLLGSGTPYSHTTLLFITNVDHGYCDDNFIIVLLACRLLLLLSLYLFEFSPFS